MSGNKWIAMQAFAFAALAGVRALWVAAVAGMDWKVLYALGAGHGFVVFGLMCWERDT